jgi:hypothetical protein
VTVRDAGGNTVTSDTSSVQLTITTAGGATLACNNNPQGAVAGAATFAGCSIDHAGTYTLTASDTGLTPAVSSPALTIAVGPAVKVGYVISPSATAAAGFNFGAQPAVAIRDAGGNTVTTDGTAVSLMLAPTTGGAVLTCTINPQNPVSGVAVFSGCHINNAGTYTLTAGAGAYTVAVASIVIS